MTIRRESKQLTGQLQQLHEKKTKSLQDLCSNRLDKAREDLAFRSEQNIATFTYVTVVFLPIGFTASIFSLNGSPESSLAIEVVIASVIAFAVTMLALMSAKGLAGVLENIAASYKDLTANAKKSRVMVRDRKISRDDRNPTDASELRPSHLSVPSTDGISWNLAFWTGYIFIELPSKSITAACRTLGWPRDDHKDLEGLKESKSVGPFARSVVASGLRYCLVPSMTLLEMEAAALLGRTSMEFPREPVPQLIAEDNVRKAAYATKIARVLLGLSQSPFFCQPGSSRLCSSTHAMLWLFWEVRSPKSPLPVAKFADQIYNAELVRQGFNHISFSENDGSESSLMTHLTKPPDKLRPMKIFKTHLQLDKKPLQSEASTKVVGEEKLASSLDKLSQAAR